MPHQSTIGFLSRYAAAPERVKKESQRGKKREEQKAGHTAFLLITCVLTRRFSRVADGVEAYLYS
jgi:hypothetical protein